MSSLYDLIVRARSVRRYDQSRPLKREQLVGLVDMARLSSSSINIQPLRYYIATGDEAAAIRPHTGWGRRLADYSGPENGENPTAYIVVCLDNEAGVTAERFARDIGIVSQTIHLGAAEAGLGSCMIGSFAPKPISEITGIPERYTPVFVVALGYPAEHIVLEGMAENGNTDYYRTPDGTHHVPKRSLDEVLLN